MSDHEPTKADQDLRALGAFLLGNADLERLEALLGRFNIFEAIGVVRQELRHSDLLAFLLDPRGSHGLGEAFLKRLLQRVLATDRTVRASVTPIELELWSLNRVEVRREWNHIDVLLLDEEHKLAVIVENKIGTSEHSGQLRRYYEVVKQHHPGWQIIGLYLTPIGEAPSHQGYVPVDYGSVCEVMDALAESRASVLNPDVKVMITHYTEMLRRNIVGDSEVARLCQQIYRKHKRALDLIYEHRPDVQAEIREVIESLIEREHGLELDQPTKSEIVFGVRGWDKPAMLGNDWTPTGRILLFDFWNTLGSLDLKLYVVSNPSETRRRLLDLAQAHPEVFKVTGNRKAKWVAIFSRQFLGGEAYEDADQEERKQKIQSRWAEFLAEDLPRIDAVLKEEAWIWESVEADG